MILDPFFAVHFVVLDQAFRLFIKYLIVVRKLLDRFLFISDCIITTFTERLYRGQFLSNIIKFNDLNVELLTLLRICRCYLDNLRRDSLLVQDSNTILNQNNELNLGKSEIRM